MTSIGLRAVLSLFVVCLGAGRPARAQELPSPDALVVCPLTAAEVQATTGLPYRFSPLPRIEEDGMPYTSCRGTGNGIEGLMVVRQTWADPRTAKARLGALLKVQWKGAELVPGDPDGARWRADTNAQSYVLLYVRGNVLTELIVMSPPKDRVAGLRDGLLKLRRVP